MTKKKRRCVECVWWTCAFDNTCINPASPLFEKEYVSPNTGACIEFEEEVL